MSGVWKMDAAKCPKCSDDDCQEPDENKKIKCYKLMALGDDDFLHFQERFRISLMCLC